MLKKLFDKTILKFILVGVINTAFGTAVMLLFYNVFHLNYWISSASNYFFGSILSYFLNKYYTFQYKKRDIKVVLRFALTILICYLIAYGIAKPLFMHLFAGYSESFRDNAAMLGGTVFFVGLNYLGQRFFAFKK